MQARQNPRSVEKKTRRAALWLASLLVLAAACGPTPPPLKIGALTFGGGLLHFEIALGQDLVPGSLAISLDAAPVTGFSPTLSGVAGNVPVTSGASATLVASARFLRNGKEELHADTRVFTVPVPAPALVSSSPAAGASNVPRTAWLRLEFASAVPAAAQQLHLECGERRRGLGVPGDQRVRPPAVGADRESLAGAPGRRAVRSLVAGSRRASRCCSSRRRRPGRGPRCATTVRRRAPLFPILTISTRCRMRARPPGCASRCRLPAVRATWRSCSARSCRRRTGSTASARSRTSRSSSRMLPIQPRSRKRRPSRWIRWRASCSSTSRPVLASVSACRSASRFAATRTCAAWSRTRCCSFRRSRSRRAGASAWW